MRLRHGFTLIEISISVFILLLIMLVAVPSLSGVMADRRLRRSLDGLNRFVLDAQGHSVSEHRPYLIVWRKGGLAFLPADTPKVEEGKEPAFTGVYAFQKGETFKLSLPYALEKDPPAQWMFWASGTCEPAVIDYKGVDGSWSANYSPLTARAEVTKYGR